MLKSTEEVPTSLQISATSAWVGDSPITVRTRLEQCDVGQNRPTERRTQSTHHRSQFLSRDSSITSTVEQIESLFPLLLCLPKLRNINEVFHRTTAHWTNTTRRTQSLPNNANTSELTTSEKLEVGYHFKRSLLLELKKTESPTCAVGQAQQFIDRPKPAMFKENTSPDRDKLTVRRLANTGRNKIVRLRRREEVLSVTYCSNL